MTPMLRPVLVVLSVLILSGCAFTKATLDVGLTPGDTGRGPLSSVPPMTVGVAELADKRPDTARIGYKKTGFGSKSADIVTERPVSAIVREAIAAEFAANGHRVGEDADLLVSGTVTTFWFELTPHFGSVEFAGTVGVDLVVSDARTGRPLVTRAYQGNYTEKTAMGGLEGTWKRVMNTALERMVRDLASDPRLLAALRDRGTTKAAAREP
jgi:uncharacterized lipoprotein YajG